MNEAVIEFDDVSKVYRLGGVDVKALDGVTVSFRRGDFWAVMGPSGSGKSTMLNLLGCLDRPTHGRCLLNGVDVATLDDDALSSARLQGIGFIFQSFNLIPQLTVRENIELPLFYMGHEVHDCARRAGELAEQVGLGNRLHHRPTELSGGQRQRVAIARALANEPSVILADEPTGNLDTATGRQIMDILSGLHREGRTLIMVTHEPDIAAHASHRLHLRDGRIERIETPEIGGAVS
jgi:putative ABC transport system ATP-binding protein